MNAAMPLSPEVHQQALERWRHPHPDFASGQDPRSSDGALLSLLYGSLEKAARYNWLNGGRTLIDKTYLRILWTVEGLSPRGLSFDEMASRLDRYLRTVVQPEWTAFPTLPQRTRQEKAVVLVEQARQQIFGTDADAGDASTLLFFLCPQLPVLPGFVAGDAYDSFLRQSLATLAEIKGVHESPLPEIRFGQEREQAPVRALLFETDWWPRRLLLMQQRLESVAQD